jgi:glycerophosphoryl diester phosphodiesterase
MAAFRGAVEEWRADVLEVDVRLTRDGHVVVLHDPTVDRTPDGSGFVSELTLAEIRSLDAGARFVAPDGSAPFRGRGVRIPRFEDVLGAFPRTRINAEAKEPAVARPLVQAIRRHGAEHRVLVAAEFEKARRSVVGYPGPWGASRHHILGFLLSHRLPGGGPYTPEADALQIPEVWKGVRILTPRLVREAHRRNIPVHVWTVDDPDDMRRLLGMGVDAIQTDRPDLLADVLTEVAGRPPAPARAARRGP